MKVAFIFVLIVAFASAQDVERILIDNFRIGAGSQIIEITLSSTLQEGETSIVDTDSLAEPGCGGDLLGCGRDMRLEVFSGFANRSFDSSIFDSSVPEFPQFVGEWAVENPKTSSSEATLQYDGTDNSFDLDITVTTDLQIVYTVEIYDTTGGVCEANLVVERTPEDYDLDDILVDIPLSQFSGCDLTSVGAFQFILPSDDAVDAIVRRISIDGLPDPSASETPSPSRTPSPAASGTGTPTPTGTRTPTRTPSTSGPCIFVCECPSFTCQLAFDQDDDYNTLSYSTAQFVFDDSDDSSFIYVDDGDDDQTTIFVYVDDDDGISTGFSTFFSTGFSTFFSTGFTSFSTGFSTFASGTTSDATPLVASVVLTALFAVLA